MNQLDHDPVEHPQHYTQGKVECLEAIESMLGPGYEDYLRGQIVKYLWRSPFKGNHEDYRKAQFYLARLVALTEPKPVRELFPGVRVGGIVPINENVG